MRNEAAHLARLLDTAEQDIAALLDQRRRDKADYWRALYFLTKAAGGKIIVRAEDMADYDPNRAAVSITHDTNGRQFIVEVIHD
jgi:hypothetical protein